MPIATLGISLPDLDEGVLDVMAVAVDDLALDAQPLAERVGAREDVLADGAEAHREIGADRLRGRLAQAHQRWSSSAGVASGPRSTMSQR